MSTPYGTPPQPSHVPPLHEPPRPLLRRVLDADPTPTGLVPTPFPDAGPFHPEPGPTGLLVETSCTPRFIVRRLCRPVITVDGQVVPDTPWGATHIPARPGQHRLRVATGGLPGWWLFSGFNGRSEIGHVETPVPVVDGHRTHVYYRTPINNRLTGSIGAHPQKARGMLWAYLVSTVFALFLLLMLYAAVAGKR